MSDLNGAGSLGAMVGSGNALLNANLTGLSADDVLVRSAPDGNNIHWIVGHIVFWRNRILQMLGGTPVWQPAVGAELEGVRRNPPPETVSVPFDRLVEDHALAGERLTEMLGSPWTGDTETLDTARSLLIHELYHVGQVGVLRRVAGKPGVLGM